MTKQEVKTALKCCLSYDGYSECSLCPYRLLISDENPFGCSTELYNDTIKLLGDNLSIVDLDKAIQDGK